MKLVDPEKNTKKIDSNLLGVLSAHEAQKFQAIKTDIWANRPPEIADSTTVDSVNHTVIVPAAQYTPRVLPEPVFGEPPVKPRAKQSNQDSWGGVL